MIIKLELTEQEMNALTALMDLGVKAGGLNVAINAAILLQKLTKAVEDAKASVPTLNGAAHAETVAN